MPSKSTRRRSAVANERVNKLTKSAFMRESLLGTRKGRALKSLPTIREGENENRTPNTPRPVLRIMLPLENRIPPGIMNRIQAGVSYPEVQQRINLDPRLTRRQRNSVTRNVVTYYAGMRRAALRAQEAQAAELEAQALAIEERRRALYQEWLARETARREEEMRAHDEAVQRLKELHESKKHGSLFARLARALSFKSKQ